MNQQDMGASAIRRPRSLIWFGVLILVVSWFVALWVTAPVTLIPIARMALPTGVQLIPLSGTFWHGQWRLILPRAPAMTIHTDFLPLSIIRLQPAWHVRARTDVQANQPDAGVDIAADVAPGFKKLSVRNLQGRLLADSPLVASLTAWPFGGMIDFTGDALLVRTERGFNIQTAQATANWRQAQITTTEPLLLGDLAFNAELAHGQLTAIVKPVSGPLEPLLGELSITGVWPLKQAPTVRGYVQTSSFASTALAQQLGLLGTRDASGKITIQGVLPGRY